MSKKAETISIRIEPDLKASIKEVAEKQRRTMSQQLTWIVVQYLTENKKG